MRKIIAVFTLGAFVLFSGSCIRTYSENAEKAGAERGPKIVGVQTKSGEYVEFRKNDPAAVVGKKIVGNTLTPVELNKDDVKLTKRGSTDERVEELQTKDGRSFKPATVVTAEGDKLTFKAYQPFSVPLSDVQLVWVRKTNVLGTVALSTSIVLAVAGAVVAISSGSWGMGGGGGGAGGGGYDRGGFSSCPFVYSYDGEQYAFDAEPYGTAVCRGLKRIDYVRMDHLMKLGSEYKVLLTNQLNETDYTDELKLIAVDHPRGITVVPDALGKMHTVTRPLPPQKATDQKGRDILSLIAQSDTLFWVSDPESINAAQAQDLRDELTFEFTKPVASRQAKLIVNAWTTLWGAAMADKFLELRGREIQSWYDDVNRHGPEFTKVMRWFTNEELYMLRIWVETRDGWKVRGVLQGGEPRLTKDKAVLLDISDIPGETLRVKLRPPVNFWMVNGLAVDYSQDLPVETAEISALKATDQNGADIRLKIAALDNDFLATPSSGGYAEVLFPAPPPRNGLDRTMFLKAAGYYDIQLDKTAEPRLQLFDRAENEPGFAVRYALEEYKAWLAGLRANLGKH